MNSKSFLLGALAVTLAAASSLVLVEAQSDNGGANVPDQEFGPSLTEKGTDVLIAQRLSVSDEDKKDYAARVKVLADLHGWFKPGTVLRIQGNVGDARESLPPTGTGTISLWPVKKNADGGYSYFCSQVPAFPIGISDSRVIAAADVDKAAKALAELAEVLRKPQNDAASRKRALELLEEKNYYLWALGVWMIAHDTKKGDVKRLESFFYKKGLTIEQAIWLDLMLSWHIYGEEFDLQPSKARLHDMLLNFLVRYGNVNAGLGENEATTAPTTSATSQPS